MEDLRARYNPEGSTLRKAQMRMLDVLIETDKILRRHNIEYWLDGGTALGAVRHGGFIPWDDDVDICVRWEDYPRVRKILQKELPDNLAFQDRWTEWYVPFVLAKVRDKNSFLLEGKYTYRVKDKGIYIDIIPFEEVIPSTKLKKHIDYIYRHCLWGIRGLDETILAKILAYLAYLPIISIVGICRLWVKIFPSHKYADRYGSIDTHHFDEAEIFPVKEITFEGHKFLAPGDIDRFLTTIFGDYMQIPPEEKRRVHNIGIEIYDEPKKEKTNNE